MLIVYRFLLYFYPHAYRCEFGEEMLGVFRALQADTGNKGVLVRTQFCAREITGLLGGAFWEHARPLAGLDPSSMSFSRRFTMRSEFRFPKSTVTLMTLILAGVVMAIEKATAIRASVAPSSPHVGPIQPAGFTFLPTMLLILGIASVAGVLGWGLLFAFHRAGVHRLAEFDPSASPETGTVE